MTYHKRAGFTFVEVIITVAIISLLSTLAFISYSTSRAKARDASRVSSVNQLMTALQLYKYDTKSYPTAVVAGQAIRSGSVTYIGTTPVNPEPRTDGGCADTDYHYVTTATGYQLTFCLGADTGGYKKGINVCVNGQCRLGSDTVVYDSDGNPYGVIVVGNYLVLDKNLQTKTKPDGTCINGGGQPPCPEAVPYQDSARVCPDAGYGSDCSEGAMYRWNAAMNGSTTEGAQGICPSGWHIPTSAEFTSLSAYLTSSATSEYIRWPGGVGHRIRYYLNGQSGTILPYANTAQQAEIRYNYRDPNYQMLEMPLNGFGMFGVESGDEFTDIAGASHLTSSSEAGAGMVSSYTTLIEQDGQTGIPTGNSTGSLTVNDAREALPLRCIKSI